MPSTETRRYADLIVLIREIVNDAEEDEAPYQKIWELANEEEKKALVKFGSMMELYK